MSKKATYGAIKTPQGAHLQGEIVSECKGSTQDLGSAFIGLTLFPPMLLALGAEDSRTIKLANGDIVEGVPVNRADK